MVTPYEFAGGMAGDEAVPTRPGSKQANGRRFRHAYTSGWRWGLVCGLVAGSMTTICAVILGITAAGAL